MRISKRPQLPWPTIISAPPRVGGWEGLSDAGSSSSSSSKSQKSMDVEHVYSIMQMREEAREEDRHKADAPRFQLLRCAGHRVVQSLTMS